MKSALALCLWMTGPVIGDEQVWPAYLSEAGLRDAIGSQAAHWPACESSTDAITVGARIILGGDGKVREVSGEEGLSDCWRLRLGTIETGDHPEDGLKLRLSLYIDQGRVQNILTLERVEQEAALPFIHLPMSLTEAQKGRLRQAVLLAYDRPEE
jgi:hypothetical protein